MLIGRMSHMARARTHTEHAGSQVRAGALLAPSAAVSHRICTPQASSDTCASCPATTSMRSQSSSRDTAAVTARADACTRTPHAASFGAPHVPPPRRSGYGHPRQHATHNRRGPRERALALPRPLPRPTLTTNLADALSRLPRGPSPAAATLRGTGGQLRAGSSRHARRHGRHAQRRHTWGSCGQAAAASGCAMLRCTAARSACTAQE